MAKVKETHYDALLVSRDADHEAIEAAYNGLIVFTGLSKRRYVYKNPDDPNAEKLSKEITRAYEVLSDPVRREEYDAALAEEDAVANKTNERAPPVAQSTEPTKTRDYFWVLDTLPGLAAGQFCSKWLLTVFHVPPEASAWVSAIFFVLGGGIGYFLCYYLRTQLTKYTQNRRTVFFVSLSISLGLTLAIVTATVFFSPNPNLDKPREMIGNEAVDKPASREISDPEPLGLPIPQDTALQKTKTLAEQGNAEAQFKLGAMHYAGDGVVKDYQEAMKWYRLSADQGFPYAQYNLGCMYYAGEGVVKDYQEAMKWFRLSADQGIASAQNSLGLMYANGQGAPQDFTQAMMWYSIAKAVGVAAAEHGLQQLEPQSTPAQIAEARRLAQEWNTAHHPAN